MATSSASLQTLQIAADRKTQPLSVTENNLAKGHAETSEELNSVSEVGKKEGTGSLWH